MSGIITVFGATGSQGGSVVNAILASGQFKVRGVTRDLESDASKALKNRGAEMVRADFADKESLRNAVRGSEIVFGVTMPVSSRASQGDEGIKLRHQVFTDLTAEVGQGKDLADAVKSEGCAVLIFRYFSTFRQ